MKQIFIILLLITNLCFAEDQAKKEEDKKPDLGSCDEYTDYYIYKCQPFVCKLPVAYLPGVTRQMEVIGFENGACTYKFKIMIRNPKFTPTDIKKICHLSQAGRLEVANEFTQYKKGKVDVYTNPPPSSERLTKECHMY